MDENLLPPLGSAYYNIDDAADLAQDALRCFENGQKDECLRRVSAAINQLSYAEAKLIKEN